jgi:hypothetical protein
MVSRVAAAASRPKSMRSKPKRLLAVQARRRAVAQPSSHQLLVQRDQWPGGMPVLRQDHGPTTVRPVSRDNAGEMMGQPDAQILDLAFLGIVHTVTGVDRNGLTPAVQRHPIALFHA